MQDVFEVSLLCEDDRVDGLLRPDEVDECIACMERPDPCVGIWFHDRASRCGAWMCSACVLHAARTHCDGRPDAGAGVRACVMAFLRAASCPLCRAEVNLARGRAGAVAAELFPHEPEPEPRASPWRRLVVHDFGTLRGVLALISMMMLATHETSRALDSP